MKLFMAVVCIPVLSTIMVLALSEAEIKLGNL